jgi:hypothetical protein
MSAGKDDKHKCFSYKEAFEGINKHEIKRKSLETLKQTLLVRKEEKLFAVNRSLVM